MLSLDRTLMFATLVFVTLMNHHTHRAAPCMCTAFAPPAVQVGTFLKSKHASGKILMPLNAWGQKKKESQDREPLKSEISEKRRKQLGISENEREYDLGVALETNTDPLITKIIAGSFILVVIALLVAGIVIPSMTDYGEGVCNPITSGGRC